MQETQVQPLGQEDPLEKKTATRSSILVWKTRGQRSLAGYGSWGLKELRNDRVTELTCVCAHTHTQSS